MSAAAGNAPPPGGEPVLAPGIERFLTFEVVGAAYALPIGEVVEVAEAGRVAPVPGLPRSLGGVMHYHGDALPVVVPTALFDLPGTGADEPRHVLVLADASGDVPRLGLPVDRVVGLADTSLPGPRRPEMVAARLPIDGRVTGILDAERLCSRAAELVARAGEAFHDSEHGGET